MKVRGKALDDFGQNSIRKSTPMAMLEDVLVPVYFIPVISTGGDHKKIVEENVLLYAIKGDGQVVTKTVSKENSKNALNTIYLIVWIQNSWYYPENIIKLIPPRPAGYDYKEIV